MVCIGTWNRDLLRGTARRVWTRVICLGVGLKRERWVLGLMWMRMRMFGDLAGGGGEFLRGTCACLGSFWLRGELSCGRMVAWKWLRLR